MNTVLSANGTKSVPNTGPAPDSLHMNPSSDVRWVTVVGPGNSVNELRSM